MKVLLNNQDLGVGIVFNEISIHHNVDLGEPQNGIYAHKIQIRTMNQILNE